MMIDSRFFAAALAALLTTATSAPAMAAVQITIYERGSDVIAEASGTLNLPPISSTSHCGGAPRVIADGAISPALGAICVGSGAGFVYSLDGGPTTFGESIGRSADESWGSLFGINSSLRLMATAGPIVDSQSIWPNTRLSDLGLQPGPIGTWTLDHPAEGTITAAATPAPLGLLGLGAMLGWARRLRRRIRHGSPGRAGATPRSQPAPGQPAQCAGGAD